MTRFRAAALGVAGVVALTVLAGAQSPTAGPKSWRIVDGPADLKPAVARADALIAAQHSALLRQLSRTLGEGPAIAIQECHLEATSQEYWVARKQGIAIGRTSDRLRSPTNAPRPWAAPIVKAYAGRQAAEVDGMVVDLGDRVGVMRPITMQPVCAGCHGAPDRFKPVIAAALVERYPRDTATGFTVGEIRGWYWAEIPKGGSGR